VSIVPPPLPASLRAGPRQLAPSRLALPGTNDDPTLTATERTGR
jgi:hypothetical protein